jgi:thiol-disulfide isomerase/thioredoxin
MYRYQPAAVTEKGIIGSEGDYVQVEFDQWKGKWCPLLRYIDVRDTISAGDWIIVFYDANCGDCQEKVPKFEQLARQTATQKDVPRISLIQIPSNTKPGEGLKLSQSPCIAGKLTNTRKWVFDYSMPVVVFLKNGIVEKIQKQ